MKHYFGLFLSSRKYPSQAQNESLRCWCKHITVKALNQYWLYFDWQRWGCLSSSCIETLWKEKLEIKTCNIHFSEAPNETILPQVLLNAVKFVLILKWKLNSVKEMHTSSHAFFFFTQNTLQFAVNSASVEFLLIYL